MIDSKIIGSFTYQRTLLINGNATATKAERDWLRSNATKGKKDKIRYFFDSKTETNDSAAKTPQLFASPKVPANLNGPGKNNKPSPATANNITLMDLMIKTLSSSAVATR